MTDIVFDNGSHVRSFTLDKMPAVMKGRLDARLIGVVLDEKKQVVSVLTYAGSYATAIEIKGVIYEWQRDTVCYPVRSSARGHLVGCCGSLSVDMIQTTDPKQLAILAAVWKRALLQGQLSGVQSDEVLDAFDPLYISPPLLVNKNSSNSLRTWASSAKSLAPLLQGLTYYRFVPESTGTGLDEDLLPHTNSLQYYSPQHDLFQWANTIHVYPKEEAK